MMWHGSCSETGAGFESARAPGGAWATKSGNPTAPGGTGSRNATTCSTHEGTPPSAARSRPRWSVPRKSVEQNSRRDPDRSSTKAASSPLKRVLIGTTTPPAA